MSNKNLFKILFCNIYETLKGELKVTDYTSRETLVKVLRQMVFVLITNLRSFYKLQYVVYPKEK